METSKRSRVQQDKLPPHAPEAEAAILGCILLSPNESMAVCLERLSGPGDFYDLRHATIYESMTSIYAESKVIDLISLTSQLSAGGVLESVGGFAYVTSLPDAAPSAFSIGQYIDDVLDKKMLRNVIQVCVKFSQMSYDPENTPAQDVVELFEKEALSVMPHKQGERKEIRELVNEAMWELEKLQGSKGALDGLPTGFVDLNNLTGGLHDGEMIVLAGYPSSGKSALAGNIVECLALEHQMPVGVFSLEMPAKSLVIRMISSQSRTNLRHLRMGYLANTDFRKITHAASKVSGSRIFIEDISDLSIMQLRSKARRMKQQHGIRAIVVDYLQLLNAVGNVRKVESRQQEVTDISRGIKGMALELGIPVLALSQLNDDGKLRESRAIGQDADVLWVLENEDKDDEETSEDVQSVKLVIKKQRNGPSPAVVKLTFLKCYTRFESSAKVSDNDMPEDVSQTQFKT